MKIDWAEFIETTERRRKEYFDGVRIHLLSNDWEIFFKIILLCKITFAIELEYHLSFLYLWCTAPLDNLIYASNIWPNCLSWSSWKILFFLFFAILRAINFSNSSSAVSMRQLILIFLTFSGINLSSTDNKLSFRPLLEPSLRVEVGLMFLSYNISEAWARKQG